MISWALRRDATSNKHTVFFLFYLAFVVGWKSKQGKSFDWLRLFASERFLKERICGSGGHGRCVVAILEETSHFFIAGGPIVPRLLSSLVLTIALLSLATAGPRPQLPLHSAAAPVPPDASAAALPDSWTKTLNWRSIGPCSMGGRIVALAVCESDPTTFWAATASGGLIKTTNGGTTFVHQFDKEATVSIGDVAVAPSNKDIVWVGTGEHNPRNSVSYGDGVYKSTDGGKSWKNMGLKKSFQIGRILIHPTNPDIVYVGALGRLYGPNEERGLYKTTDGGQSWTKVLHVDDNTGVIDMKMHPTQPDTLLVATWERQRDGFDSHAGAKNFFGGKVDPPLQDGYDAYDPIRKWGKGSGLYKTTDGGQSWKKITQGLPTCELGRIGLDYYQKDPNIVYAVVDSAKIGTGRLPGYLGVTSETAKGGGATLETVVENSPAAKGGLKKGDIITSLAGKPVKSTEDIARVMQSTQPGDKLAVVGTREGQPLKLEITVGARPAQPGTGGGPAGRRGLDFKLEETKEGLRIAALVPQGPAAKAGLKVGDIIQKVGGKALATAREVGEAIRGESGSVKLEIARDKEKREITYTPLGSGAAGKASTRPYSSWLGGQRENVQATQGPDGFQTGGVYRSTDGGETWRRVNSLNPRPMYFSQIRVDPSDDKKIYVLGVRLHISTDGGKTFNAPAGRNQIHDDQHALWINPRDGRHLILGTDGGVYVSYDRAAKWDFLNHMALGQFYHVAVDNRKPYRVYGGLQDNGTWGGPSRGLDGRGPMNADWIFVSGGDGFRCAVDPLDDDVIYYESQDGNIGRRNLRTGERKSIRPQVKGEITRFNWNTPFLVSSHNPKIFYCAGNKVFKSIKQGEDARVLSPELCKDGRASATALAESPLLSDVLWVGTDDGQLWVTRDGGVKWTNVVDKVGLPKPMCVATIEASRFVPGRAYVAFDGHRSDDDEPYVYVTEDYGATWKSLRANLPTGSTRCLREDLFNKDLLYLGTEFAVWASIDRGTSWTKINNNLPTVAVHELAQHPTAGEIVAATHGRSLWILDVTALRQLTPKQVTEGAKLLTPATVIRWRVEPLRGTIYGSGDRDFFGTNPEPGGHVFYTLGKKADKVKLEIQDVTGKTLSTLKASGEPGLHRATWNLRSTAGVANMLPERVRGFTGRPVASGMYRVVLTVDGKEQVQPLKIENDPTLPPDIIPSEAEVPEAKKRLQED
jgi:photosystem II stability/assembly factor-like uncharacterized protein